MLNNTNISNLILLTKVFAADLWWSSSTILEKMTLDKLTIVLHCFVFYCWRVLNLLFLRSTEQTWIYSSFRLRFIHYTFWCEWAFTFAINITSCIKNKQSENRMLLLLQLSKNNINIYLLKISLKIEHFIVLDYIKKTVTYYLHSYVIVIIIIDCK